MNKSTTKESENHRLSLGIAGLDEILRGGFIPQRAYLVRGGPGTGKTTLGVHFLAAGAALGENTLLITLGEPAEQILENGQKIGLNLDNVTFLDLSPDSSFFTKVQSYDIFSPAEVEREPVTKQIVEKVEELKPNRVFIDSMTQFRFLAADSFQFRKQVLSCIRFLLESKATLLFTSENSPEVPDNDLQFMSDGVINVQFQEEKRTVNVTKFRGSDFRDGVHSLRLGHQGIEVFPKLLPKAYKRDFNPEPVSSGIPALDELLHGGIERGTVTFFRGPSGVGKTTIGLQFMKEAAGRGERSVVYTFEEEVEIILKRSDKINIPARSMINQGSLSLVKIEPLQYSPDEFASIVRKEVEERDVQIVMLDSISGYSLSMQGEDLASNLHALCKYLANMGVTVILIDEAGDSSEQSQVSDTNYTYLADNLILMRYMDRHLEDTIELRKTIAVMKKRLSDFEKTLREFRITKYGIQVSQPLTGLEGILSGDLVKNDQE